MIPPVMNRPMFNQAQPQLQAPQMSMNPQAQQIQMAEKQASAQALAGMAQGMEDLNQQLENAENYTGVMDALRGNTASVKERRGELAQLVGDKDANKTPESVLTLVQPTMMFLEVAENAQQNPQQSAPGGINNLPLQSPGAQPTMPSGGGGITNFFAGVRSPGTQEAVARMEQGEQPVRRAPGSPPEGEIVTTLSPLQLQTVTPQDIFAQYPAAQQFITAPVAPGPFEEYLGKAKSSIGSFIPQARSTTDILKEYQTTLGDPTKDLAKSSFYGGLTKFGAQLAQKEGGLLAGGSEALLDVAPGISEDFTKVTQAKTKQDQAMKLAALQQSQAEKKAFDQNMFSLASNVYNNHMKLQTDFTQNYKDYQKEVFKAAQGLAANEVKAANDMAQATFNMKEKFAGKEPKAYVSKESLASTDPNTPLDQITVQRDVNTSNFVTEVAPGKYEVVDMSKYTPLSESVAATAKLKRGDKPQDGVILDRKTARPKPIKYILKKGQFYIVEKSEAEGEINMRPPEANDKFTPSPYKDVVEIKEVGNQRVITYNYDGTPIRYADIMEIPQRDARTGENVLGDDGLPIMVKQGTPESMVASRLDQNGEPIRGADGKIIYEPLFKQSVTDETPFVQRTEVPVLMNMSEKQVQAKQKAISEITRLEGLTKELFQFGLEGTNYGFVATVENIVNNNLEGIMPSSLQLSQTRRAYIDKLVKQIKRTEVITQLASDKNSVTEQTLVMKNLVGDADGLFKSPRAELIALQEYLRFAQNKKRQLQAELNGDTSYLRFTKIPTGEKDNPFTYDQDSLNYIKTLFQNPATVKIAQDKGLFLQVPITAYQSYEKRNLENLKSIPNVDPALIARSEEKLRSYQQDIQQGIKFKLENILDIEQLLGP